MRRLLALILAATLAAHPALAELRILSAGAVEPGLEAAIAGFRAAGGQPVAIAYATAPRLRQRLDAGETPDLVIVPVALIRDLSVRLHGQPVPIGRVGIGIVARADAPPVAIRDAASLAEAVRQSSAVVFNRASTGLALDRLFERLDLTTTVAPKAARFATGAEVLDRLRRGTGPELGFAAITEILLVPELRYLGPMPPALQNHTAYAASLLPGSDPAAAALLGFLASAAGRAAFARAGIEQ